MLTPRVIEILDRACDKLRNFIITENGKFIRAENNSSEFIRRIKDWNEADDLDFIIDHTLGSDAEALISSGSGRRFTPNYKDFISEIGSEDIIKRMFNLRRESKLTPDLWLVIEKQEYSLDKKVHGYRAKKGRPFGLTRRFVDMAFIEISNAIADIKRLKSTLAELTEASESTNLPFELLQMKIRKIVNEYIELRGLQNESDVFKAMIAWFVLE
jgi:hypothetical protein